MPVLFPIHPRTRKRLTEFGFGNGKLQSKITFVDPLSYLDFLNLMMHARVVLTDSGGIQEETTVLGIPCLTLRENTERPITISEGTNRIAGTTRASILESFKDIMRGRPSGRIPELWDGKTAERIAESDFGTQGHSRPRWVRMRIGFYLGRETYLKTLGCLIQESISMGHDVVVYYEQPEKDLRDKSYQIVNPAHLSVFKTGAKKIIKVTNFAQVLSGSRLDILVVHEGFHTLNDHLEDVAQLRRTGTKVISIMHFFETTQQPLSALDAFDITIYPSKFGRDLHFELQCKPIDREKEKIARRRQYSVAGEPMFDQIAMTDRKRARKELNMDPNVPTVLFVAPVISPITPWRFTVWGKEGRLGRTRDALKQGKVGYLWEIWTGDNFKAVAQAIRDFCDRNGARLIVKSRGKQASPMYLKRIADVFIDGFDDVYFPVFTGYKLMAASDLCITVNSMAATEAVALGIPCINIYVPHLDFVEPLKAFAEEIPQYIASRGPLFIDEL